MAGGFQMAYANWPRSYGRNETTGYVLMGRRPPLPSPPPRLRAAADDLQDANPAKRRDRAPAAT